MSKRIEAYLVVLDEAYGASKCTKKNKLDQMFFHFIMGQLAIGLAQYICGPFQGMKGLQELFKAQLNIALISFYNILKKPNLYSALVIFVRCLWPSFFFFSSPSNSSSYIILFPFFVLLAEVLLHIGISDTRYRCRCR